ncbi:Mobile element protein [Salmonella enterica subsp. arizonae]|uniref:Mobile element protein n=1 Tax=Salmonella enterica subsp. arizonae TaxID=59203 RepID=A0A379T6I8_SALER|nr:Mobile element protein [Salmonella enterica subsp. arizonae]
MALNDSKIRSAKTLDKSYKLTDSQGLYLTVSTSAQSCGISAIASMAKKTVLPLALTRW